MRLFAAMLFVLLCVTVNEAKAFEFHGIKSGMSEEEFAQTISALGGAYNKGRVKMPDDGLSGVEFSPLHMSPEFDNNGKLYSITISYLPLLMDGVRVGPFKAAFKRKYKVDISEEIDGRSVILQAILIDAKLADAFFKHVTDSYMGKI